MVFVDLLAIQLFVLGFAGLTLVYLTVDSVLLWRAGKNAGQGIAAGQIPLAVIGVYMLVSGMFGQFTWPLPGSYNILFYDIYPIVGLFLIAAAWAVRQRMRLQYIGFFGLMLGLVTAFYGVTGYNLGLTLEPISILALYGLFGVTGVLGYPMTLMFDRSQAKIKNKSVLWVALLVAFVAVTLIASLLAVYIGVSAVPGHLLSAP